MRIYEYMRMPRIEKEFLIAVVVLAAGIFVGYSIMVHAQDAGIPDGHDGEMSPNADVAVDRGAAAGITFPVAELGGCNSKEECKTYCNDTSHMDACVAFAEAHGLMNKEDVSRAKKFREVLHTGGGPGGCTNPRDCQAYCSNTVNLEACVNFAKKQGIKDKHVEQGEKILAYQKTGGTMPGGCASKDACEAYCSDFSHAEECYNFAKSAGITQVRDDVPGEARGRFEGDIPPGQFQKFLEVVKRGETPGACTSKDSCEAYCQDPSHREECVSFGEKIGAISSDEAALIRKTGGKGPGGCTSRESCEAFCNDPTHREECFNFAKEHGFIGEEEIKRTQEGFVQLRAGLEQAPPEVAECMKTTLGENIIGDIQSGKLVPGPEIGDRVRGCFEKFGEHGSSNETFKNVPTAVRNCLRDKIGANELSEISAGAASPTPEMADTMRVCFQSAQFEQGFSGGGQGFQGGPGGQGGPMTGGEGQRPPGGFGGPPSIESFKRFVETAPPEVAACIKEQLGGDIAALQAGGGAQIDTSKVKTCFEQFRPQTYQQSFVPGGQGGFPDGPGMMPPQQGFGGQGVPPPQGFGGGIEECVRQVMGSGTTDKESAMKICYEKMQGASGGQGGFAPQPFPAPTGGQQPLPPQASSFADCARKLFGDEMARRIQAGEVTPDQKEQLARCVGGTSGSTGGQYPNQYPTNTQYPNQYPSTGGTYPPPTGTYPPPSTTTQCPTDYNPFCGKDGKTYQNACFAKQAGVEILYAGACRVGTTVTCSGYNGPMCGYDNKTYPDECAAKTANVMIQYVGECSTGTTPPPTGTVYPPPPDGGTYTAPPPDGGTYTAPPPTGTFEPAPLPPPPQSSRRGGFLGAVGGFFRWLFY